VCLPAEAGLEAVKSTSIFFVPNEMSRLRISKASEFVFLGSTI
jgi:hypothetical protein